MYFLSGKREKMKGSHFDHVFIKPPKIKFHSLFKNNTIKHFSLTSFRRLRLPLCNYVLKLLKLE